MVLRSYYTLLSKQAKLTEQGYHPRTEFSEKKPRGNKEMVFKNAKKIKLAGMLDI